MTFKLRVARATNNLAKIAEMYRTGLELNVACTYEDLEGFRVVLCKLEWDAN